MATLGRASVLASSLSLVLTALLTALLTAPVASAAPASPGATTVSARCIGGPGRLVLAVDEQAPGVWHVDVTGRRLADDSRWRVTLGMESEEDEQTESFRRRAVDGTWTYSTEMTGPVDGYVDFFVEAHGSDPAAAGDGTSCVVVNNPHDPTFGAGFCAGGFDLMQLHRREDGTTVLRYGILFVARNTTWTLDLTVDDGPDDVRSMTFDDVTNKRGRLWTRVELTGLKHPTFGVQAVSERGGRCSLYIDPAELETGGSSSTTAPGPLLRQHLR